MRLPNFGDTPRQWLVGLGVIALFLSLFGNYWQGKTNHDQAAAFNAAQMRKDTQITIALNNGTATLASIQALQQEVSTFVSQIHTQVPQIAGALIAGTNTLIGQYNAVIAKENALCVRLSACGVTPPAPLVPLPRTTTTTTTVPVHHHGKRARS